MLRFVRLALPALVTSLVVVVPGAAAAPQPRDVREGGPPAAVPAAVRAARGKAAGLPNGTRVAADRRTGGVRQVQRPGGALTGRSAADPAAIALAWARAHLDVLGVAPADLDALVPTGRYVDPDGTTHLRWVQSADGLRSFDTGLEAHVARDGRLLAVQGAAVPGLAAPGRRPAVSSGEALAAAGMAPPAAPAATVRPGPERATTFASGQHARLVLLATPGGPRRAWEVIDAEQQSLVDAQSGEELVRRPLVLHADADGFPRDPDQGPPVTRTLPAGWSEGSDRLAGRWARAYADVDDDDLADPDEEIAAGAGGHWRFPLTNVPTGTPCPASGCTWDGLDKASAAVNRASAATNAFLLVNELREWLAADPVGFDAAAGGFADEDRVIVEVHDGGGTDNANMATPPDGWSPRMQLYLWTSRDVDSAHDASVVFHEYVHGLTNRLVVTPGGASALLSEQARSMGEAWSDWYALDALVARGLAADGAEPDVRVGTYVVANGIRSMPMDCPPNAGGTPCRSTGGLTYGDMKARAVPHSAGEVWTQTLWDLRTALGSEAARRLVTAGLRLAPDDPDVLDMRDAILTADAGANAAGLWAVFAARGMGYSAASPSGAVSGIVEAFDLPYGLRHAATAVVEAGDASDADGVIEPGESVDITETLHNAGTAALGGTGTLTSATPGLTVERGRAEWPSIAPGATAPGTALRAAVAPTTSCYTTPTLSLTVDDSTGSRTIPVPVRVGPATAEGFPGPVAIVDRPIPDGSATGTTATLEVPAAEAVTISDLNVRIDELRHTWVGDLVVTLRHDGVAVRLVDRIGRTTSGYGNSGDDLVDVVLDDEAAADLEGAPLAAAPFSGRWRPAASLSAFDGRSSAGTWTIEVADLEATDTGVLRRFGFSTRERPCVSERVRPGEEAAASGPVAPAPAAGPAAAPAGTAAPADTDEGPPATPAAAAAPAPPAAAPRPAVLTPAPALTGLPRSVRVRRGRFRLAFRARAGATGRAELWAGRRRVGAVRWRATRGGRVVISGRARRLPRGRSAKGTLVVTAGRASVRRAVALRLR